jgi:DsbC/DsbD-like thiol-disulfide interchange protein
LEDGAKNSVSLALEKQKDATKKAETEARKVIHIVYKTDSLQAKIMINELTKKNEELKKEIKINKAAKAYLKAHDHDKHDVPGHYHLKDDPNHSTIEVVKKQLQQKEQELQQVNSRMRRMLFVWNRGQLMKKSAYIERNNMVSELEQLRIEVSSLKQTRIKLCKFC